MTMADLPSYEHIDELVDIDPIRLRDVAWAMRQRAEKAEQAVSRVRALAERLGVTDPGLRDEILTELDQPATEEHNHG